MNEAQITLYNAQIQEITQLIKALDSEGSRSVFALLPIGEREVIAQARITLQELTRRRNRLQEVVLHAPPPMITQATAGLLAEIQQEDANEKLAAFIAEENAAVEAELLALEAQIAEDFGPAATEIPEEPTLPEDPTPDEGEPEEEGWYPE